MVEMIEEVRQCAFVVPDETNLHRTLNIAWPYRRKQNTKLSQNGPKALTECEEELLDDKLVLDGWARPDGSCKSIEQAGKWYGALKMKYAKLAERMEMGASAHFESSGEEEDEDGDKKKDSKSGGSEEEEKADGEGRRDEFESKRKKKTKEQIEKEALEGNLYGALEINENSYDVDEKMITKAYRKMALKYHPDKLGREPTEKDKELWLKI